LNVIYFAHPTPVKENVPNKYNDKDNLFNIVGSISIVNRAVKNKMTGTNHIKAMIVHCHRFDAMPYNNQIMLAVIAVIIIAALKPSLALIRTL
jgi:hypothetical protein